MPGDTEAVTPPPSPPSPTGPAGVEPARTAREDRLLPWIAAERFFRGIILAAAGLFVVTHLHRQWGLDVRHLAERLDLNTAGHLIHGLIRRAGALTVHQVLVIGIVAVGYGLIEMVEGIGLWRRQRWAEYLTIIVTSLLIPVEIYELAEHASLLKVGGLLVNIAIVLYLLRVLKRHSPRAGGGDREAASVAE